MAVTLTGTTGADTILGGAGDELLLGLAGNDSLSGGDGNDTLDGGSGTNRVDGGAGDDLILIDRTATNGVMLTPSTGIDGGLGYDTVSFAGTMAEFHITNVVGFGLTITDLVGGARTIAVGVEHLQFTDGDIWLVNPNQNTPVVSGTVAALATEGGVAVSVDPLALATDADAGAVLTAMMGALPAGVSFDGSLLTLDPGDAAYDILGAGVTQVVTVDYQVSDGLHVTPAQATFTVTGVNDAATFLGNLADMTEDGSTVSGVVTVSDVDAGEAHLVTQVVMPSPHGVFAVDASGSWSFRLDTDALEVQALGVGEALAEQQEIVSADGTVGVLQVTVAGTADALRIGSNLAETLNGSSAAERIFGLDGADVLNGKAGADTLDGGAGADKLYGGDGADRVIWDGADLVIEGGAGVDTLVLKTATSVVLSAADQVAGDLGVTKGFEAVDAGLCLGSVSLTGSDGANRLQGGYADDLIAGGRGNDVLTGGMGADTFLFAARGGVDHVTDFALGVDHLGLQGITAAQVSWTDNGVDTRVDLGGTVVMLDGVIGLTLADFLFL